MTGLACSHPVAAQLDAGARVECWPLLLAKGEGHRRRRAHLLYLYSYK